jgi:hypothetical protein
MHLERAKSCPAVDFGIAGKESSDRRKKGCNETWLFYFLHFTGAAPPRIKRRSKTLHAT